MRNSVRKNIVTVSFIMTILIFQFELYKKKNY